MKKRLWRAVVTSGELCLATAVGEAGSSRNQVRFQAESIKKKVVLAIEMKSPSN